MPVAFDIAILLSRRVHGGRPGHDRCDDVLIAGAAADIALEAVAHARLRSGVGFALGERHRAHDHAGRAEAALQAVIFGERLLHRMQALTARPRQALDRRQLAPSSIGASKVQLFTDSPSNMHDTGAALAGVAADMRAGQVQVLAQQIGDQLAGSTSTVRDRPLSVKLIFIRDLPS